MGGFLPAREAPGAAGSSSRGFVPIAGRGLRGGPARAMLPNFLIIGAQKAGTTWLAALLRQHPEVFLAPGEVHFFDKAERYRLGLDWYASHFAAAGKARAVGEKTPDYLWAGGRGAEGHLPDVHRNLHRALPRAKLVVVLRDPVERAISAVNHILRSGRVSPRHRIDDLLLGSQRHRVEGHGVIDCGRYGRALEAYYALFDRRQVLVLIFEEDVVASPERGLRRTCEFLGVDPSHRFEEVERPRHATRVSRLGLALRYYAPPLRPLLRRVERVLPASTLRPKPRTVEALRELYAPENERLFALLGRRVEAWGARAAEARSPVSRPEPLPAHQAE